MSLLNLPHSTLVERNIPKNAFDSYANSKQKKLFTNRIAKITWKNKISPDTVNLKAEEVEEIQIFEVQLKLKQDVHSILDLIDKSIPYHIIFVVVHENSHFISTSAKHRHPTNDNIAVIDWTFQSGWFEKGERDFQVNLRKSLDAIYKDICIQLSGITDLSSQSLESIIQNQRDSDELKKQIAKLKSQISTCKQFNRKVELNLLLKSKEDELQRIST